MSLVATPVTEGTIVDTNQKLSATEAQALYAAGVRAIGRYVFFRHPQGPGDLDAAELAALTDAGLIVFPIQHVRMPGWTGSYAQGVADAVAGMANAAAAGFAPGLGLALALDLEGCKVGDPDQARGWCDTVAGHYQPLVYVGYASGMTTADLDALAGDPRFWCDFAPFTARPTPTRGYDLHQQAQTTMCGVGVDKDTLLTPGAFSGLAQADAQSPDSSAGHVAAGGA